MIEGAQCDGVHDQERTVGAATYPSQGLHLWAGRTVGAVGEPVDVDDLVGAAEIAERLGLASSSVVRDWRRRYADFPSPVLTLRMGPVWHWPDVASWATETGRLR